MPTVNLFVKIFVITSLLFEKRINKQAPSTGSSVMNEGCFVLLSKNIIETIINENPIATKADL